MIQKQTLTSYKLGDRFKYNNKDFDIIYKLVEKQPIYSVSKGKKKHTSDVYIFDPIPKTYMFRDKEYKYNRAEFPLSILNDCIKRQTWLPLQ